MAKQSIPASTRRRDFWHSHVNAWRSSKLTQKEYCHQHKLNVSSLSCWKKKLSQKSMGITKFVSVPLTPTVLPEKSITQSSLQMTVNKRFTIDIGDDFLPQTLRRLVHTLEDLK